MKLLIDTNILVSASLFPNSVPAQAFDKAATFPNHAVVCDYSIDEMRRVYNNKFPHKLHQMESFLSMLLLTVEIIATPTEEYAVSDEALITDVKDRPILRAAVHSNAELLISGDHHFLDSGLKHPVVINPADFIRLY
jgi:putative PIN family toxin of toxin-antitoxin system